MIITVLNIVALLTPALVVVGTFGLIAIRHQRLFLALFMYLTALESTRDFVPSLALGLSGVSVYPEDVATVVCAFAALARMGQWRLHWVIRSAIVIVAAFTGLGVISWIPIYGLQVGVNFWRTQVLLVSLLLYTSTRPRAWSWNDLRVIIVGPAIVVALASVVGILLFGAGSSSSAVEVSGVVEGGRPVSASGSLLMLVGLWVMVLSVGRWGVTRVMVILLLGSMVLLTQNRSVWVAGIVGIVVWWLVPRIRPRGTSGGLGGLSRSLVALLVGIATATVGVSVAALGQSASDDHTWLWRVVQWSESMSIPRSVGEWLVGSAFGPTPASRPKAVSTHSLYVSTIETMGFIGLAVLLCLTIAIWRVYVPPSLEPLGPITCLTFLSYAVVYQLPPWAWMVVGILLGSTWIEPAEGSRNISRETRRSLITPAPPGPDVVDRARL